MSYRDISPHLQEIYGLEISTVTLTAVTDKIIRKVKEQARPLVTIYPLVWLDAIHYKITRSVKTVKRLARRFTRYFALTLMGACPAKKGC